MITKLRDNISKEDYKSTMDIVAHSIKKATTTAANKAKKKAMGKGKEKARSISPVEDDEFANLSDNERDQLLYVACLALTFIANHLLVLQSPIARTKTGKAFSAIPLADPASILPVAHRRQALSHQSSPFLPPWLHPTHPCQLLLSVPFPELLEL
jgi:hypothetical protein